MNATEIFKKLRLDESKKNLLINAPQEFMELLSGVTYNTIFIPTDASSYDYVQVFASTQRELEMLLKPIATAGKYDCLFWICYPKGGGKIKSDLKRDKIWDAFTTINLRPVTQIAIDETWSALRGRPSEMVGK
jgi:hypothetical protein